MKRLLRWAQSDIPTAALLTAVVLLVLEGIVRQVAWSVWGVLLPTIGGHGVIR